MSVYRPYNKKLKCLCFKGSNDTDTFKVSMLVVDTFSRVDGHLWSGSELVKVDYYRQHMIVCCARHHLQ